MRSSKAHNTAYLRQWRKKNQLAYRSYQARYMRRYRAMRKFGLNYMPSEEEIVQLKLNASKAEVSE